MRIEKSFIREKFDNIVERYDLVNFLGSMGQDKIWRKRVVEAIADVEEPIVDLCCGPFTLTLEIARKLEKICYGLDFSLKMLIFGKKKLKDLPIYPVCGDAENLPFRDESFGAVTIAFGLRNIPNRNKAIREFFRVLKPGGKLIILEFSWPRNFLFQRIYGFYLKHFIPLLGRIVAKDKEAYLYLADSIKTFPSPQEISKMLEEIGFIKIKTSSLTLGIVTLYEGVKP